MYVQKLEPAWMSVHPDNRSGMMVNSHDVHEKGLHALQLGFDEKKLNESYCFELSGNLKQRDAQIGAMKRLAENSEMRLAPISGKERFMSVSSSHISQFCKAVACGACMTEVHELASVNQGCMSVDGFSAHFQDKEFERLAKELPQWNCIKSEVETECGWLPQLLQASMNTANMIGKEPKEMEIAMALAYQYKHSGSLEKACQECKSSTTLRYVDLICHFVRQYGGGEDFSLIKTLVGIPALFGSSVWLGEEFMTAVTKVDLKSKTTLYPFCRAAMVAANLGSSKTVDGIAKLLTRADLEKLKSPQQKTRLDACERLLKLTWDAMDKENVLNDKHSLKVLARFWIRSALWLTNKEGRGKEDTVHGSLEAIHDLFKQENAVHGCKEPPASDTEKHGDKVLSLNEAADAATIAAQTFPWLEKGCNYLRKDSSAIHRFDSMGPVNGIFVVRDLHGTESKVEVPHDELKHFRSTDKEMPCKIDDEVVSKLSLASCPAWAMEKEKAEVQAAVLDNCMRPAGLCQDEISSVNTCMLFKAVSSK